MPSHDRATPLRDSPRVERDACGSAETSPLARQSPGRLFNNVGLSDTPSGRSCLPRRVGAYSPGPHFGLVRAALLSAKTPVNGLASSKQETAKGSPMPQTALRQTVRERLASGWLFPAVHRVRAGKGTGHICIVCGTTIAPSEVENEVVGPTTVWSHLPCYSIWREESQTYERVNGADGSDGTGYLADLRQTVRNRFANGTLLALPPDRSWTGRGVSDICGVCSKPIFAAESSQEVIGVQRAHAHLVCYRAWLLESIASRAVR